MAAHKDPITVSCFVLFIVHLLMRRKEFSKTITFLNYSVRLLELSPLLLSLIVLQLNLKERALNENVS